MENIYSTTSDYWISPKALIISLNALDNPQYIQVSLLSGAAIMAYKSGIIDYDESHNYRKWNLEAYNTLFETPDAKYVYVQLDIDTSKSQALIVYSDVKLDIIGREENSEEKNNNNFYYIYLGTISSATNSNGEKIPRIWEDPFKTGDLSTDKFINEDTLGEWSKMFRFNKVTGVIDVLKDISSAFINNLTIGTELILNKRTVKKIDISSDDIDYDKLDDSSIISTKLGTRIFLSKTSPDEASELITFLKGITSVESSTFLKDIIAKGLIQADGGLVVRKQELVEATLMSLIEEDEDALVEELSIGSATTLGELANVSPEADTASKGSILVKDDIWSPVSPALSDLTDYDNMLMPVFHKVLGKWIFISVSSIGGVTPPVVLEMVLDTGVLDVNKLA